uniref:Uncharacterized protein n=1 Tax=Timema monikensis TaxID=170555 RepID=A0A7R9HLV8_9NEOP|nr:unnamed protein product [Timema monikensis]
MAVTQELEDSTKYVHRPIARPQEIWFSLKDAEKNSDRLFNIINNQVLDFDHLKIIKKMTYLNNLIILKNSLIFLNDLKI